MFITCYQHSSNVCRLFPSFRMTSKTNAHTCYIHRTWHLLAGFSEVLDHFVLRCIPIVKGGYNMTAQHALSDVTGSELHWSFTEMQVLTEVKSL